MSVVRSLHTGRVIAGSNGASAWNLLQPLCTKDLSESSVCAMFHLDYLSCLLTVLATILLARKSWTGLLIAIVNSLIVCAIALRTSQLGFIPANLFCICVYGFSMRSWLKKKTHTNRDQARRQDSGTLVDSPRMELRSPDTDAPCLQRLLADRHRPPLVFISLNSDIKSPVHMVIHDAIANDVCPTIENHVCSSKMHSTAIR
jgi:hypothetical protein